MHLATTQLAETMTAICIDGISHAVMLASPFELEDFALGFALSEALIESPDELRDIHVAENETSITLDLHLSPRAQHAAKQRRRQLQGSSGCGLCGADAIAMALAEMPPVITAANDPPSELHIAHAREVLHGLQTRNRAAGGGMHAAALFGYDSASDRIEALAVREDVGRHNALDKLIGAIASKKKLEHTDARIDYNNSFAMLTSRCGYELVLKCARAGIRTLVTLAVPTTLAVQCAERCNIALACYHGPQLKRYYSSTIMHS